MIYETTVRSILNSVPQPDTWFGLRYNMNLYRGCQHQCIYCDSRSECYRIDNFADVQVKVNALELLAGVLPRKRSKGLIGFGSMSDTYGPVERQHRLTRGALQLLLQHHFPPHIITKSDRVLDDLGLLAEIAASTRAVVTLTITTLDAELARIIEPGAPAPALRVDALAQLNAAGVEAGVALMPLLPWLTDSPASVEAVLQAAVDAGATHIIPSFGLTMRDRQRDYFYAKLDRHYPGLSDRYRAHFGARYFAAVPGYADLEALFNDFRRRHGFATSVAPYTPRGQGEQPGLL